MATPRYIEKISLIPSHMQDGMVMWIEHACPPGDFLTAVLENDLRGAVATADDTNREMLPAYVLYLHNYAPATCWGSRERVRAWKGLKAGQEVMT